MAADDGRRLPGPSAPAHSPYGDLTRPPLSQPALTAALVRPGGLWTEVRVLAETASTNAVAADAARAGAPQGLVVLAESQTAGRGRLGRSWQSPPRAGVTLSVLLRPEVADAAEWGWLPLLSGLAAVRALRDRCGVADAVLKWPNDVLAGSPPGKLAGLLAEVPAPGSVVVGLGLNASTRSSELPPGAVSLATLGAAVTDRDVVVRAVLRELADAYDAWHLTPESVRTAYREVCDTIGRRVVLHLPGGGTATGLATGVDEQGRLVVDGVAHAAGDVVHVR